MPTKKRKPRALTTPGLSEIIIQRRLDRHIHYNTALEGATTNYPDSPGYRSNAPETSREAAEAIATMTLNHRAQVLAVLNPESRSSDQIAYAIGLSPYSVRPRKAAGKVERTDDRAKNDGGRSVVLWRAA